MQTVSLDEAHKHLPDLVRRLALEGDLVITDHDEPIARLAPILHRTSLRDIKPSSVGVVLRPFPVPEDDLLGEMLSTSP